MRRIILVLFIAFTSYQSLFNDHFGMNPHRHSLSDTKLLLSTSIDVSYTSSAYP
ncbi:TPA: hypothetical protein TU164_001191 [Streptococcus equi subsp. zooepidemicus]|nr:hypothetical protein [Streptococcus equi subsp. zooepidemicus]HEL0693479.1 hypothetical protein [Streptococcus equi subsp. zooepidemicus]HEL0772381.1 hypothetical protein [Streptococcus equi subsp. zooepidemicus]